MIRIVVNPKYQHLESLVNDLPMTFMHSGEVLYAARNIIKTFDFKGIRVNVKSFKKPILINQFIYATVRKSKAKRSYLYAFKLKEKGFLTPDPIAYMEQFKGGLLFNSLYISVHEEFDGIMRELYSGDIEGREKLLRQFALYTADLHEQQVLHLDYSSGNILYKKEKDHYRFYLVDLNRMIFDKFIDMDKACFSFRRLWGSDDMIRYIVKIYAQARNFDEAACLKKTFEYREKFWDSFSKQHPGAKPYAI